MIAFLNPVFECMPQSAETRKSVPTVQIMDQSGSQLRLNIFRTSTKSIRMCQNERHNLASNVNIQHEQVIALCRHSLSVRQRRLTVNFGTTEWIGQHYTSTTIATMQSLLYILNST